MDSSLQCPICKHIVARLCKVSSIHQKHQKLFRNNLSNFGVRCNLPHRDGKIFWCKTRLLQNKTLQFGSNKFTNEVCRRHTSLQVNKVEKVILLQLQMLIRILFGKRQILVTSTIVIDLNHILSLQYKATNNNHVFLLRNNHIILQYMCHLLLLGISNSVLQSLKPS